MDVYESPGPSKSNQFIIFSFAILTAGEGGLLLYSSTLYESIIPVTVEICNLQYETHEGGFCRNSQIFP